MNSSSRSLGNWMSGSFRLELVVLLAAALTTSNGSAATKTWDGSSSGDWATGANWSGNTAPAAGDDLVFPTGVTQLLMTNNFSPNRAFNSVTILGANYVIRGNPLVLTNGIRCGNSSAANAIELSTQSAKSSCRMPRTI